MKNLLKMLFIIIMVRIGIFREDAPDNAYTGYYYHKPGDTKGGITIKYSNGNSKETGYYSIDSAEKALSHI